MVDSIVIYFEFNFYLIISKLKLNLLISLSLGPGQAHGPPLLVIILSIGPRGPELKPEYCFGSSSGAQPSGSTYWGLGPYPVFPTRFK